MQTPTKQRYPSELSRGQTQPLPRTSDVPYPSEPSSQHEYSSLAELLTKAGYKETRVFTPEAEKVRSRRTDHTIRPRDSTAILRSIAMQDQAQAESVVKDKQALGESTTWYQGPLAALGWPAGSSEATSRKAGDSPVHPTNVGLGLAHGGQGVRRVKSAWDVASHTEVESPTLRPYQPVSQLVMAEPPAAIAQLFSPSMETYVEQDQHLIDDEYGFDYGGQPLPDDYEAAGSEDDYGYDDSRSRETTADAEELAGVDMDLGMLSLGSTSGSGSDDGPSCLTPHAMVFHNMVALDDLEDEDDADMPEYCFSQEPDQPPVTPPRLSPTPSRSPSPATRPTPVRTTTPPKLLSSPSKSTTAHAALSKPSGPTRSKAETECLGLLGNLSQRRPALKSTKSTPALRNQRSSGWLNSLSRGFWKTENVPPLPHRRVVPVTILSPPQPAPPALNVESSVLCDSNASEGEDLPPISRAEDEPLQKPAAPWTLRIRPSLQALRDAAAAAIGASSVSETAPSPTLSPKLDWGIGGDSDELKGWGMTPVITGEKSRTPQPWSRTTFNSASANEADALFKEPDFTQSFFYKPPTPERPKLRRSGTSETTASPPRASTVNGAGKSYPVAKRARSIQSLRAALLLPVRPPSPPPPVPALPRTLSAPLATPSKRGVEVEPPIMVISSPGAWEAGLPPRELVLEGEEWDARESPAVGLGIRKGSLKGKKKKLRKSPLGR